VRGFHARRAAQQAKALLDRGNDGTGIGVVRLDDQHPPAVSLDLLGDGPSLVGRCGVGECHCAAGDAVCRRQG
jgi:hypothetical protein